MSAPNTPSASRLRRGAMMPPPSVTPSGSKTVALPKRSLSLTPSKRIQPSRQWLTSPPKKARESGGKKAGEEEEEEEGAWEEGRVCLFPAAHHRKKGNEEIKSPLKDQRASGLTTTPGGTAVVCSPSVKRAYSIVRRCTGSLGGNGSGGAIYGELTSGSMQKVVDLMVAHCDLNKDSLFIDVGSGLGKPNIHVAQDPGVAVSYGIEHEEVRWYLGLHNLKHLLDEAATHSETFDNKEYFRAQQLGILLLSIPYEGGAAAADEALNHKIFFQSGDIMDAHTFDPFTHVYMFDIGFPPTLFKKLSAMFNRSQSSKWLICYHGPKIIVDKYGFHVELLVQKPTSMHGSAEGHTAYCYRHVLSENLLKKEANHEVPKPDKLYKEGLDLLQKGSVGDLRGWVDSQLQKQLISPRPDRKAKARTTSSSLKLDFNDE